MAISRLSQTKVNRVGASCVAIEYPIMDDRIHGVIIKLTGRYPDTGWTINEKCTELIYVVSGKGKLSIEGEVVNFVKGDQMLIGPGKKFYWEGNCELFMPCTPAWYPEQHRVVR